MRTPETRPAPETTRVRLDKWLWAARFFKTRALAVEAIERHRVWVNGTAAKPARELKPGDTLRITAGPFTRDVVVRALSGVRGPAPQAALLYEETPESITRRETLAQQRRLAPEPASSITDGRPTKRNRRRMGDWNERWSASLGED